MTSEPTGERLEFRPEDSTCYGCSARNPRGLQLRFFRAGPQAVECRLTPPDELNGAPGIVHGGVQATILDEAMGYACHADGVDRDVVTIEMQLRYRRPARTGLPLVAKAEVVAEDDRDLEVRAVLAGEDGTVLTEATARFRRLG